jgi:hypothetical protein
VGNSKLQETVRTTNLGRASHLSASERTYRKMATTSFWFRTAKESFWMGGKKYAITFAKGQVPPLERSGP